MQTIIYTHHRPSRPPTFHKIVSTRGWVSDHYYTVCGLGLKKDSPRVKRPTRATANDGVHCKICFKGEKT